MANRRNRKRIALRIQGAISPRLKRQRLKTQSLKATSRKASIAKTTTAKAAELKVTSPKASIGKAVAAARVRTGPKIRNKARVASRRAWATTSRPS